MPDYTLNAPIVGIKARNMKNNIPVGQVFYLHTEPQEPGYPHLGSRATVALKRIEDSIFWGLSICGYEDNFSKSTGREIALERLNNSFGRVNIAHFKDAETESEVFLKIANDIAYKVMNNFNHWKHRVGEFEENLEATMEPLLEADLK